MSAYLKIAGVSDVSVGYGSPQIPALMESLSRHWGQSNSVLLEPDQPEKKPAEELFSMLNLKRVYTTFHPYSSPGRIEYINKCAKEVDRLRPDVLVIFCTFCLPVLFKISYRPRFVIYYAIESTSSYGMFDIEMNRRIGGLVDLIIYPEENRVRREIELCGYMEIPYVILYNCANSESQFNPLPPDDRNGRILYAGTIDRKLTFADYYLSKEIQSFPIDLYGFVGGDDKQFILDEYEKQYGNVRYLGYLENKMLARIRKKYAFSIVMWNPINDNLLYAAPNKFFESIFDCVPPIVAPHPQCKELVKRYKCGIVMDGWDFDSFCKAIEQAVKIFSSQEYNELINSCSMAVIKELHWAKQFKKIEGYLNISP